MICLASHLPLLRIGRHEVASYETTWLAGVLRDAASAAGHVGWWPADDVARGVLQFLRERFEPNIITLQELFEKIGATLRTIGFPEVASHMRAAPPPVDFSLLELAREADGLEMAFFVRLGREVRELRAAGVQRMEARELRSAVLCLSRARQWDARCRQLEEDIVNYARSLSEPQERSSVLSQEGFTLVLTSSN